MPENRHSFFCVDGHTCGNPVRLVAGGAPLLNGSTMSEKRQDFLARFDWIRKALMFEPRGHDMMSGSFLYPPTSANADTSILFIETSGCLPMCGHGTIGTLTMGLEQGLIHAKEPGKLVVDVPAGQIEATYEMENGLVSEVRIRNVASYLAATDIKVDVPGLGEIKLDVSYGGNYYAIVEPQENCPSLDRMSAGEILHFSPLVRKAVQAVYEPVHPDDSTVRGVSHVLWTGKAQTDGGHARNAVFYGDKAIDRSPCGTGTSARMAQLAARGELKVGDDFHHESIICSIFKGRVEALAKVGNHDAIIPSVAGWARMTGLNTIFVDEYDPLWAGFQVT